MNTNRHPLLSVILGSGGKRAPAPDSFSTAFIRLPLVMRSMEARGPAPVANLVEKPTSWSDKAKADGR